MIRSIHGAGHRAPRSITQIWLAASLAWALTHSTASFGQAQPEQRLPWSATTTFASDGVRCTMRFAVPKGEPFLTLENERAKDPAASTPLFSLNGLPPPSDGSTSLPTSNLILTRAGPRPWRELGSRIGKRGRESSHSQYRKRSMHWCDRSRPVNRSKSPWAGQTLRENWTLIWLAREPRPRLFQTASSTLRLRRPNRSRLASRRRTRRAMGPVFKPYPVFLPRPASARPSGGS